MMYLLIQAILPQWKFNKYDIKCSEKLEFDSHTYI